MKVRGCVVALLMAGASLVFASPAYAYNCTAETRPDGSIQIAEHLTLNGAQFYGNRGLAADIWVYQNFVWETLPNPYNVLDGRDYDWSDWWLEINDGASNGNAMRFGIVRHRIFQTIQTPKGSYTFSTYGDPTIRVEWGPHRDGNGNAGGSSGTWTGPSGKTMGWKDIRGYGGNIPAQQHRLKFFSDPFDGNKWKFYIDNVLVYTKSPVNGFIGGRAWMLHASDTPCGSSWNEFRDTWRYSTANKKWIDTSEPFGVVWSRERDTNDNWSTTARGSDWVIMDCTPASGYNCEYFSYPQGSP